MTSQKDPERYKGQSRRASADSRLCTVYYPLAPFVSGFTVVSVFSYISIGRDGHLVQSEAYDLS